MCVMSEKQRILFFNAQHGFGGCTSVHLAIMKHLDRSRYQVFVATHTPLAGDRFGEARDATRINLTLPQIQGSMWQRITSSWKTFVSLLYLVWYIRLRRVHLLHTTEKPRDSFYGLLVARAGGCKHILHAHLGYFHLNPSRPVRFALRHTDRIVTVSEHCRRTFLAAGYAPSHVSAVLNSVDTERFRPTVDPLDLRSLLHLPSSSKLIGIIGRIYEGKGQGDLVEAMADVVSHIPDAHLVIVGSDDMRGMGESTDSTHSYSDDLRARAVVLGIQDHVHFVPWRTDTERVFKGFDVAVNASFEEPFGLVVVEAMGVGVPLVATAAGGIPEIVTNENDALLVSPHAPNELACAIRRILEDKDLASRLTQNARATVETRFAEASTADQMQQVYTEVLRQSISAAK